MKTSEKAMRQASILNVLFSEAKFMGLCVNTKKVTQKELQELKMLAYEIIYAKDKQK